MEEFNSEVAVHARMEDLHGHKYGNEALVPAKVLTVIRAADAATGPAMTENTLMVKANQAPRD